MAKTLFIKCVVAMLLVAMLAVGFASCGGPIITTKTPTTGSNGDQGNPGTSDTTEPPRSTEYPSQLSGMKNKTDGKTIQFAYTEAGNGTYVADSLWVDSEANDLDDVDKAILNRNANVAQDLGVTIEATPYATTISGLQEATKTIFDMQQDTIDVYCGYQYYDISFATQGHLYNLNDLTNDLGETLINTEKGYWASNYIDSISYNDYTYWVTGDITFLYSGGLYCTYVNTALYDTYVKSSYDGKSIYQIVNDSNNLWTMQTMIDMAQKVQLDTNGNGKADNGETVGFVYEPNDIWEGLAFGCQVEFGKKSSNPNGPGEIVEITFPSDKKAKLFADYCNTIYKGTSFSLSAGSADGAAMMPYFAAGQALFAVNKLYMSAIYLYDMESFAIVPTPKLNKDQKNYASGCHDSLTIFGISKYSDCADAAAATLELMAYYSHRDVTPVFYEKYILGSRTVREDESIVMINKIRDGFDSDFVAAWSNKINNIAHFYRSDKYVKAFKFNCETYQKTWPNSLAELLAQLDAAALGEEVTE